MKCTGLVLFLKFQGSQISVLLSTYHPHLKCRKVVVLRTCAKQIFPITGKKKKKKKKYFFKKKKSAKCLKLLTNTTFTKIQLISL